mgnify:CR=1 FL=1
MMGHCDEGEFRAFGVFHNLVVLPRQCLAQLKQVLVLVFEVFLSSRISIDHLTCEFVFYGSNHFK